MLPILRLVRPRFDWIAIPGGPALIGVGSAPDDALPAAECPAATVVLPAFAVGRTPVTNATYARFVAATGHRAPAHWEAVQRSPEGALDRAATVWLWTSRPHRPTPTPADDGRFNPAAPGQRVLRGGSFRSPAAEYLRGAFRSRSHPTRRRDHIGFRVARDRAPDDP